MCTQCLAQADRRGRFPLAQRCWRDRRYVDVLATATISQAIAHREEDFGLELPVELKLVGKQAKFFGHLRNWLQLRILGDFNVAGHRKSQV
jgi:hypothetical protein